MNATVEPSAQSKLELIAEVLRSGHSVSIRVRGASMLPSIWPGDLVTVEPLGPVTIGCGDVILFTREARVFAHRVRRSGPIEGAWITRGDSVPQEDSPVERGELLGRVTMIRRDDRAIRIQKLGPLQRFLGRVLGSCARLRSPVLRLHRQLYANSPSLETCWRFPRGICRG